jgi:hypothetical protein
MNSNIKSLIFIIFILFILDYTKTKADEDRRVKDIHRYNRKIYNDFKNATLGILVKEWEKTYYDFYKLRSITYLINHNRCNFSIIYGIFIIVYNYNKKLINGLIPNYPVLFGVLISLGWYNILEMFPIIRTDELIFYTVIGNLVILFINKYLNIND